MMRSGAASPRASRNRNPVRQENGLEAAVLGEQGTPAPFPAVANDGLIQAIAPPVLVAVPNVPVTDEDKAVAQRYFDHVRQNSAKHVMVDDEKFIRKFNDDYTYSDIYDGEVTSSGIWFGFDKNSAPENFPYDMEEGKTYIVINDTSTTLAFMISSVSNDKLELFYLDGGLLQFNKK